MHRGVIWVLAAFVITFMALLHSSHAIPFYPNGYTNSRHKDYLVEVEDPDAVLDMLAKLGQSILRAQHEGSKICSLEGEDPLNSVMHLRFLGSAGKYRQTPIMNVPVVALLLIVHSLAFGIVTIRSMKSVTVTFSERERLPDVYKTSAIDVINLPEATTADGKSAKRGLDLGLARGFSGSQAAKHLMGLAAANFAAGPGKKKRGSDMSSSGRGDLTFGLSPAAAQEYLPVSPASSNEWALGNKE